MDNEFWDDKEEKAINVGLVILIFTIALIQIATIFMIIDTNRKISDLERRNMEVHEYILNKIGG